MNRDAHRVVVVSSRRYERKLLAGHLSRAGFAVAAAASGEDAIARLDELDCAVLVVDERLPDGDGVRLVSVAHARCDDTATLLVVEEPSVPCTACGPVVAGHDCIRRPVVVEELERRVRRLATWHRMRRENLGLRRILERQAGVPDVAAVSACMRALMERARRAAAAACDVLLVGEPGSGRERVARAIHGLGPGRDGPFVSLDLTGIPQDEVEVRLFGGAPGVLPGRSAGLLGSLRSGTLFLDDVADLSATAQDALLRILVARDARGAGPEGSRAYTAPRLVAATRRELRERVEAGAFSCALFGWLAACRLDVAPLRERREDIPELVGQLLRHHAARTGAAAPLVSDAALELLHRYPWKGNVRELSNVLERALMLSGDGVCDVDQLPADLRRQSPPHRRRAPVRGAAVSGRAARGWRAGWQPGPSRRGH